MKDIKPIIKKLKDYIEKTEYWKYEDGLVLGSDEAQQLIEALGQVEKMKEVLKKIIGMNPESDTNMAKNILINEIREIAEQALTNLK